MIPLDHTKRFWNGLDGRPVADYSACMADRMPYQEGIIKRYYNRRDDIMLARLGDLVSELYLATETGKCDRLWARVAQALKGLGVSQSLVTHILDKREPDLLARHLKTWLAESKRKERRRED